MRSATVRHFLTTEDRSRGELQVAEAERSLIIEEAENRLHTQKTMMKKLLGVR